MLRERRANWHLRAGPSKKAVEPQIALFNAGKGAAHMFETDEIYQMWEELLQLQTRRRAMLNCARSATISSSNSNAFPCSMCSSVRPASTFPSWPRSGRCLLMANAGQSRCARGQVPQKLGEFTAKDMRHSVFLITQLESEQTDAGLWRSLMGIGKADTVENVAKKVEQGVQIVDDYQVVIHAKLAPELIDTLFLSKLTWPWRARCVGMLGARSCMDRRWWAPALRVPSDGGLVRPLQAGGESLAQDT